MSDKKPIDTTFQNSLTPEDQAVLSAVAKRMSELKAVVSLTESQARGKNERDKLSKILRDMLLRYEDIPQAFEIGGLPVSYTQGEQYIDEQALLMAGVSKGVIEKCKRRKPGFFVVDRGGKVEKGEKS